jgi:hypothetical protein
MDRLYGELNKFAQLANEPTITDELLDARKQQAIAVYQNRAGKCSCACNYFVVKGFIPDVSE